MYDVRDKRIDSGWAHPCVLQALAHLQGIRLRLWQLNGQNELISHPHYPVLGAEALPETNLLFVNNNHFDRLEFFVREESQGVMTQLAERSPFSSLKKNDITIRIVDSGEMATPEFSSRQDSIHVVEDNEYISAEAQAQIKQGDVFVSNKDLSNAIVHYKQAAELTENFLPHLRLGYCYWLQGLISNDDSFDTYYHLSTAAHHTLTSRSNIYYACVLYAQFLYQRENFETALIYLKRSLRSGLIQNNHQFNYTLFDAILLPIELQVEVKEFVNLEIGAVPLAYYLIIHCLHFQEEKSGAEKYLQEFSAWTLENSQALNYSLLGYCYKLLGKYAEAAIYFLQAAECRPNYELAKRNAQECNSYAKLSNTLTEVLRAMQKSASTQIDEYDDEDATLQAALNMSLNR